MLWESIGVDGNLWGICGSLWINMSMRLFMNAMLCISMGVYGCLRESMDKYKYVSVYECLWVFMSV